MNVFIKFLEHMTMQPDGDRDPSRHPSYSYEVVAVNGDTGKSSVLFQNDQFDAYNTHINGTRETYRDAAYRKAERLAAVFGVEFVKEIDVHTKRITELRLQIENAQKEVTRLEKLQNVER
jgi:hypothetical protein